MTESEFYSFEKALQDLALDEEDLKRLISAGEIRAFRDGSKMRLRADDVARVASDLGVGGKVGEEEAGEVLEVEEVLFSESAEEADEGMVTTQLSEEETLLDEGLEVVDIHTELGPSPAAAAPRASRTARSSAPPEEEGGGLRVAILATTALMIYALSFIVSMADGRANSFTRPLVNLFTGG